MSTRTGTSVVNWALLIGGLWLIDRAVVGLVQG